MNTQEQLKEKLSKGIVIFTYEKKDGSKRLAIGTTSVDHLPPVTKTAYEKQMSTLREINSKLKSGLLPEEPADREMLDEVKEELNNFLYPVPKEKKTTESTAVIYFDFTAGDWRVCTQVETIIQSITANGVEHTL